MAKHRSDYPYYWQSDQTWWNAVRYQPRHRGIYNPPISATVGVGPRNSMHIKIIPYMTEWCSDLKEDMNDMITFKLGPWLVIKD